MKSVVWVEAGGTGAGIAGCIIIAAATIRSPLALQPCRAEGKAPCARPWQGARFPALRQTI